VARISNRAMIGAPGCRNEKFLRQQVKVAEQAIPMSQVLNWFPQIVKPLVFANLSVFYSHPASIQSSLENIFSHSG